MNLVEFYDKKELIQNVYNDVVYQQNRGNLVSSHIADIHFGAMDDPKVQYDILVEQYIERLKPLPLDYVSINGDTFDHKSMANSDLAMYATLFVDKLVNEIIRPKGITLLIIGGTYSHDAGQLKLFYKYMSDNTVDVRVVETIKFEYIKNAKILCIPELSGIDESVYRKYLFESGIYDEVCMHGTIKGAVYGDNVGEGRLFTPQDFVLCRGPIISGHIHNGTCLYGNMYYCGTPYSWRFDDESDDKGFLICLHNLDTHWHYVHKSLIASFRYVTVTLDEMIDRDPKSIIDAINNIKLTQNIDFIRVQFNKEVDSSTKQVIDSFFRNNKTVTTQYKFTKEDKQIQERMQQSEWLSQYDYLYDKSLNEYDCLSRFINDDKGYQFISSEQLKQIVEECLSC